MKKMNARKGQMFCISAGPYDDTTLAGPYVALEDIDTEALLARFAEFPWEHLPLGVAQSELMSGTFNDAEMRFVAWLEQQGIVDRVECPVINVKVGWSDTGRRVLNVGGKGPACHVEYGPVNPDKDLTGQG